MVKVNFRQYVFLLFIILKVKCVAAQQKKNDTIFLHNKIFEFYNSDTDSLIFYSKQLGKVSKTKYGTACSFIGQAKAYYQKRDLTTSEKYAILVVDFIGENPMSKFELINLNDAYRRLFYIKKNQGKYEESIYWLTERERILERFIDEKAYLRNLLDIKKCKASVKIKLELYDEALKILNTINKRAEVLDLKQSDEKVIQFFKQERANILNLLGNVYTYMHDNYPKRYYIDSAKVCYRKAYMISKSLKYKNDIDNEAYYALRMIDVLLKKKKYLAISKSIKNNDSIFRKASNTCKLGLYYKKSIFYLKLKKYDSSIFYSKKYMLELPDSKMSISRITTIYDNLAKSYTYKKQNDSALKYSNLTLNSYKEIEKHKKATVKNLFEVEIAEVQKLNNKLNKKKENSNIFLGGILIIFLCVLSGIYVLYNKQFLKKKKEQQVEQKLSNDLVNDLLKRLSEFEQTTMYLDESFNSNVLADYLKTNTTYLSQVVNQYKEKTFKQYVSDLRINYVIEKLHNDKKFQKYSIESIGKEIGYSNASAFTRAFKKKLGVTPSEYIKTKIKNGFN